MPSARALGSYNPAPEEVERVKVRARVGLRLRGLRERRGLTQAQLAARAELSHKFVGEIERGTANPTVDTLAGLAEALGVEIAELFEVAGPEPRTDLYSLTPPEVQRVREALESLEAVVEHLDPRPRRRRTGPKS